MGRIAALPKRNRNMTQMSGTDVLSGAVAPDKPFVTSMLQVLTRILDSDTM